MSTTERLSPGTPDPSDSTASATVPGPRTEPDDRGASPPGDGSGPARPGVPDRPILAGLERIARRLKKVSKLGVASLFIAIIGLGIAFQPDQFQRIVADHYADPVEVGGATSTDPFVDKIVSVGNRHWLVERIWGTRVQFVEVEIDNGSNTGRMKEAPTDDDVGVLQVPTSRCPDGRGAYLKIFLRDTTSSQFGALNAPQRRYVLDGMFDVGNVRSRYSEADRVEYCYVDLTAVR